MIEIAEPLNSFREFPGPILLLAGPGTGKTFQLAKRVKFLIEDMSADPDEIAVITFTNEAARNMRERLTQGDINISQDKTPQTIMTMHSLGNAIIGACPSLFQLPAEYGVLSEDQPREVLLKDASTLAGYQRTKWTAADDCRRKGLCKEEAASERCQICKQYRSLLRKCSLVDYDDQMFLSCQALISDAKLRSQWQSKTRYLLVDEYQDINQAQCELIQLLTQSHEDGLFAVGDDDQSIYSFRGGSPKYIRDFESHLGKNAKVGRLSMSWRCPEHILRGARCMVKEYYKESLLKPEPTFSDKIESKAKIHFYDVPSDTQEARLIAAMAQERLKTNAVTVIIPNSNYFPPVRDALRARRIAYNYKAKFDEQGISRLTLLPQWAEDQHNSLLLRYLLDLVVQNNDELTNKVTGDTTNLKTKREMASQIVAALWEEVDKETSLWTVLCKEAASNSFLSALKSECLDEILSLMDEHTIGKRDSLSRFLEKSALFVAPGRNPRNLISEIRDLKSERIASSIGTSFRPVSIYNMPSSKGLEADVVFVVGVSEGLIPLPNADTEEQSRLFYVAMTRAKCELHLFSARKRSAHITFKPESYQLKRSPFIDVIPKEHIEMKQIYPKKSK
jgi:DNA helicase-2/ATP-dependent DNA helicase PcrA